MISHLGVCQLRAPSLCLFDVYITAHSWGVFGPSEKLRTSSLLSPMISVKNETRKKTRGNVKSSWKSITFSALCYVQCIVIFPSQKTVLKTAFGSTQNPIGTTFKRLSQKALYLGIIGALFKFNGFQKVCNRNVCWHFSGICYTLRSRSYPSQSSFRHNRHSPEKCSS